MLHVFAKGILFVKHLSMPGLMGFWSLLGH